MTYSHDMVVELTNSVQLVSSRRANHSTFPHRCGRALKPLPAAEKILSLENCSGRVLFRGMVPSEWTMLQWWPLTRVVFAVFKGLLEKIQGVKWIY